MAEQEIIEFSGLRVVRPKFLKCRQSEVRASFEATENGAPCIAYMLKTKNSTLFTADSTIKELEDECKYLGKLRHPNILQHLGVHCDKGGHVIITEQLYMSLDVYLAQGGDGFPTAVNFSVLRDVARGLQYLRSQSPIIVHRELFAENVHLGFDMRAKISVVGVSIPIDTEQVKSTDVAIYLPPEASEICSNPFHIDTKWDIYSFGILSIYTAMHKLPSKGGSVIEWMNGMGMKHPLYNLVSKCVQHHPPARLSIGKICHDLDSLCENYPFKITDIVELLQCINGTEPKCNHVEPKDRQKTCQSQPSSTTSSWYGTLAGIGTSVAGIGSKMVHNVTAVMMDTKKYDSPVDKDICMSQISCQPTIADGNEWVEVSKTKNPEDIKGDDDIAAKLHQIQIYKEDFENERKDRVSACVKLHECKVQLQKKDQELADIKVQLQSVKDKLGALEESKIIEGGKLTAELEAAKEEIAVKVAQVKQYQKQVEAYKQQITKQCDQISHPDEITELYREKSFKTSEPVHVAGDTVSYRHQPDVENESQAFCEDFAKERQDRINAITKLNRLEEELKSVQVKLEATESELERHKTILADTETIAARNIKQLTSELEAMKTEISVKVAQVKQYQKQVEMYKLQVNKDGTQLESQCMPPATTHTSGKCFVPLASESTDKARAAMVVEASDRTERGTQTEDHSSGSLATSQPQTCFFEITGCDVRGLPPPILQTEQFNRESKILASTNQHLCASIDDGSDLPPPIRLYPPSGQLCDLAEESTNNLVRDLEVEMQCEEGALEKCKDRPTQHEIPLDFNLKCPTCGKVFRKGQIQRFREHVSNCSG